MHDSFEKMVSSSLKKDNGDINDGMTINTQNTGKQTIKLFKDSSMANVSSDDMVKQLSHF